LKTRCVETLVIECKSQKYAWSAPHKRSEPLIVLINILLKTILRKRGRGREIKGKGSRKVHRHAESRHSRRQDSQCQYSANRRRCRHGIAETRKGAISFGGAREREREKERASASTRKNIEQKRGQTEKERQTTRRTTEREKLIGTTREGARRGERVRDGNGEMSGLDKDGP